MPEFCEQFVNVNKLNVIFPTKKRAQSSIAFYLSHRPNSTFRIVFFQLNTRQKVPHQLTLNFRIMKKKSLNVIYNAYLVT